MTKYLVCNFETREEIEVKAESSRQAKEIAANERGWKHDQLIVLGGSKKNIAKLV